MADTPEGFWAVVDRALAIPGFRRNDAVAYLFDPCCVTRTQLNRVSSVDGEPKNRADCGVPHPGGKGDEARTRDATDEMIIVALDDEVGRNRSDARRTDAPVRCVQCATPAAALLATVMATAPVHTAAAPEPAQRAAHLVSTCCPTTALMLLAAVVAAATLLALARPGILRATDPPTSGSELPALTTGRRPGTWAHPVAALTIVLLAVGLAWTDAAPQHEPTRAPAAMHRLPPDPTPAPTLNPPPPPPDPPPDPVPENGIVVPRRLIIREPLHATQWHMPGHELQGDAERADLVHSRNTRAHRMSIGTDPQLPNRHDVDWYIGPRVLCATTDSHGNRCQHTGIVCVRHLTAGTRRDGRAYCCTACFVTCGERHDHDDDYDPETGDRSPRCARQDHHMRFVLAFTRLPKLRDGRCLRDSNWVGRGGRRRPSDHPQRRPRACDVPRARTHVGHGCRTMRRRCVPRSLTGRRSGRGRVHCCCTLICQKELLACQFNASWRERPAGVR